MSRGWSGGVAFFCVFALACSLFGQRVPLFVDGEPVVLAHPILEENGRLSVPLEEFGLLLGVDVLFVEKDDLICLRWSKGRQCFFADHFPRLNGLYYALLDELVTLVGVSRHTIGEEIYIETEPAVLTALEVTEKEVTARFDGFVPHQAIDMGPKMLHLRFFHCVPAATAQPVVLAEGPIASVALSPSEWRRIDLVIELASDSQPQIKQLESPGFYCVSLAFDAQSRTESLVTLFPSITEHTIKTDFGEGPLTIRCLYVEEWREHYRLIPVVPQSGVGTLASLKGLAQAGGAHAGVNANFFDTATHNPIGLLIVNGLVLSSNTERRAALGIDLFGRLIFFNPSVSLYLHHEAGGIAIDDVNRPIRSNELIVYTPGYAGEVAKGTTQPFRIVKVRADRVVSVEDSPYVPVENNTTLVVGSGNGRYRLIPLTLGDAVCLDYVFDQEDLSVTNAVSAGPFLIRDGTTVLDPEARSLKLDSYLAGGLAARSVLATDYYGGLILLTVVKDEESVGADLKNVLDVLHSLPVKVKDAIAFDSGHSSSLVVKDGATYRELASGGWVAVGLLVVPVDR